LESRTHDVLDDSLWHDNGYDRRFHYFQYNHRGGRIPVSDQDPVVSDKERAVTGFGIEEEERNDPDYVLVRRHTPPFPVKDEVALLATTLRDFQ